MITRLWNQEETDGHRYLNSGAFKQSNSVNPRILVNKGSKLNGVGFKKNIGRYNELLCQNAEVEGQRNSPKEKQS